jgi:hypothetical protein
MEVNTKFNVGDQVWIVESNKAVLKIVTDLLIVLEGDTVKITYSTHGNSDLPENRLFKTKKELLESL